MTVYDNTERDWYDIVADADGGKLFVYKSFCWLGADTGDDLPGRLATVNGTQGYTCTLDYLLENGGECLDFVPDMVAGERQYIEDLSYDAYIRLSEDDTTTRLQFWQIDRDTPCGSYHHVQTDLERPDILMQALRAARPDADPKWVGKTVAQVLEDRPEIPRTLAEFNLVAMRRGIVEVQDQWEAR